MPPTKKPAHGAGFFMPGKASGAWAPRYMRNSAKAGLSVSSVNG